MQKQGAWTPMEGLADRCRDAVFEIADTLHDVEPATASLAEGSAGLALFLACAAGAFGRPSDEQAASRLLEHAVECVVARPMPVGLFRGLAGIGWVVEHCVDGGDDVSEVVDLAIARALEAWTGSIDLVDGLAGLLIYLATRLPRPAARSSIEAIVHRLDALGEIENDTRTWRTPPELLPAWQRKLAPDGYYNAGVAHGVPGLVTALGVAAAAGCHAGARLVREAVPWVLAQRLPAGRASTFPPWITHGVEPTITRTAWCYGDAGVASSLLVTARAIGVREWETEALAIAHEAARRDPTRAMDAVGLCHGSAGLAHMWNRLYQATGDDRFANAADAWYRETLARLALERPFDPGFLDGAAGVGLALLAAISDAPPTWDGLLLLSVPEA